MSFELAGAERLMNVIGKDVSNFMLKLDEVNQVNADEEVGPIMIDELHKSKRKIFLVQSKHGIVGTVSI